MKSRALPVSVVRDIVHRLERETIRQNARRHEDKHWTSWGKSCEQSEKYLLNLVRRASLEPKDKEGEWYACRVRNTEAIRQLFNGYQQEWKSRLTISLRLNEFKDEKESRHWRMAQWREVSQISKRKKHGLKAGSKSRTWSDCFSTAVFFIGYARKENSADEWANSWIANRTNLKSRNVWNMPPI